MPSNKALESMKRRKKRQVKNFYLNRNRAIWKNTKAKKREEELTRRKQEEKERKEKLKKEREKLKQEKQEAREKIEKDVNKLEETNQIKKEIKKRENKIEENIKIHEVADETDIALEKYKKELASEKIKDSLFQDNTNQDSASPYTKKTLKQQQEIDRRLKELNKKYKNLKYTPDTRTEEEKDWEELSKIMAKVSFNKGKTWLDILDDNDFTKIVEKISKVKVWNTVIDSLDPDDMMKALNSMNSVSRKALNGGSVDDRVQLLGMYLKVCKDDLMV